MLLEDLINNLYTLAEQEEIPIIKKEDFRDFLKSTKGKTISIAYRKKDGSLRLINTRTGVRRNITGRGLKYNPEEYGYIQNMKQKYYKEYFKRKKEGRD